MVSKMTDTETIMVPNPYYYNKDKLGFDELHFYNVDTDTKMTMLREGKLTRSDGTPAKDVLEEILNANEDLVHYTTLDNASVGVSIDIQNKQLSNPVVRQAIAYVIDRDAIRQVANYYGTTATYAETGMPESYATTTGWLDPDVASKMTKYSTDQDKATELLESVGWTKESDGWHDENGELISWTTITTSDFQFLNAATIFSNQLTDFGLKTELKVLESAVFTSEYTKEGEKDYEFACNWIDNCWNLYCPYGPLNEGYFNGAFAAKAGNFPTFTSGSRKGEVDMTYKDQNGEDVDISATLKPMLAMSNEDMVKEASRLEYIINENVFSIAFFQNASGFWLNSADIESGMPFQDEIASNGRNFLVPTDPDKLSTVNDHWYIWVGQGLVISDGTYQGKAK